MHQLKNKFIILACSVWLLIILPTKALIGSEDIEYPSLRYRLHNNRNIEEKIIDQVINDFGSVNVMGLLLTCKEDYRIVKPRLQAIEDELLNTLLVYEFEGKKFSIKLKDILNKDGSIDLTLFGDTPLKNWNVITINPNHFFIDSGINKNIWLITTKQQLFHEMKKIKNDCFNIQEVLAKTPSNQEYVLLYRWGNDNERVFRYRYMAIDGVPIKNGEKNSPTFYNYFGSTTGHWQGDRKHYQYLFVGMEGESVYFGMYRSDYGREACALSSDKISIFLPK